MIDTLCLRGMGLTKSYGSVRALSSASIELHRGQVVGLVGPNGAGKTTLIRILLGDLRPDSGVVEFFSLRQPPTPPGLGIGAMTEALGLDKSETGLTALRYLQRMAGLPKDAVDKVIETTALGKLSTKSIKSLSTGERRRVELAAALLGDPECNIFDEPLNGLDPDAIEWFRRLVAELKEQGKAVMVSSHILHELGRVSDLLTVIHKGVIRYSGPLDSADAVEAIYRKTKEEDQ
jgi:ABC-2 type transport system ATP-binding protein